MLILITNKTKIFLIFSKSDRIRQFIIPNHYFCTDILAVIELGAKNLVIYHMYVTSKKRNNGYIPNSGYFLLDQRFYSSDEFNTAVRGWDIDLNQLDRGAGATF